MAKRNIKTATTKARAVKEAADRVQPALAVGNIKSWTPFDMTRNGVAELCWKKHVQCPRCAKRYLLSLTDEVYCDVLAKEAKGSINHYECNDCVTARDYVKDFQW